MNKFEALGLAPFIVEALAEKGYETPTPIQAKVIPILLERGKNVIGQAQTGTGKTAAFGLPILQNIQAKSGSIQAIVLTPTRELALQVASEIDSFKGSKKIRITTVYGGQSIDKQIQTLRKGVEVVVGTPGRVIDLMKRRKLNLEDIEYFVLDEADEMLNMGFIDDIEWILAQTNENKQVLCFSATMPAKIKSLAKRYMGDYQVVAVERESITTDNVEELYCQVKVRDKVNILKRFIALHGDFYGIVFTNTKMQADDVTRQLQEANIKAEALHGDIAQNQRERILKRFKLKKCTVLVATDVAARGIDVNDVNHVINYSVPQDPEAYIHRIGRTGRAGKKGRAITFVERKEFSQLKYIQKLAKTNIELLEVPGPEELIDRKRASIMENILNQKIETSDLGYLEMAADLLDHGDPMDIIAATLKSAFSKDLDISAYKQIDANADFKEKGSSGKSQRLFVALGTNNGNYDKRSLVDFITDKSGIEEDAFLDVFVLDEFSFVTLPQAEADEVLQVFKKEKSGGKSLITKAKDRDGGGGGKSNRNSGGGGRGRGRKQQHQGGGRKRRRK